MADLRWHAVVGTRPIAGWCANVCTSAFFLHHAVRANYGGKAALFLGGVTVAFHSSATSMLRSLGMSNAILMLLGQLWYSAFWGSPAAVAAFVAPDARLGGSPAQQHVLHRFGVCPSVITVAAVGYYVVFATLFATAASAETADTAAMGYAVAASAWHAWVASCLAWSAMLGGLLGRRTNATTPELQKLIGVARSAATEIPAAQGAAFPVNPQLSMPAVAPQAMGLFRFEQLSVRVQS